MNNFENMTESLKNTILRFVPFSSFVSSSFWFKFADVKLDSDKLDEVIRHIWGYYSNYEKTGAIMIDCTSFNKYVTGFIFITFWKMLIFAKT